MDTMTLNGPAVKAWLRARGIPVGRFAAEAKLHMPEAYAILAGYEPTGPTRRARIVAALERLDAETTAQARAK